MAASSEGARSADRPRGKRWDMTSTHSLEAGAEWFRSNADATAVLVVRGKDYAFVRAPGVKPEEAYDAVRDVLPDALDLAKQKAQQAQEATTRKRAAEIAQRVAAAEREW